MGDRGSGPFERAGHDIYPSERVHLREQSLFAAWRRRATRSQSKGKGKERRKGSRQRTFDSARRGGGSLKYDQGGDPWSGLLLLDSTTTFVGWAMSLPRLVMASRTSFAWHLRDSFSACWQAEGLQTAVFPLPIPFPGVFDGGGPGLSKKRLRVLAQKRLAHLIVLVLNKLYLGRFASAAELRRFPSPLQRRVFRRLYDYITVCGFRPEEFQVPPVRSGPELIACLSRLEAFLVDHPEFRGSYSSLEKQQFSPPAVHRSLDADRLQLKGTGGWPLADYLDGELWLPYVEPAFLLHGEAHDSSSWPSFSREDPLEYKKLALKWENLGLLRLYDEPLVEGHFCKVFNAFKNAEVDRQIGDRRIPNSRERSSQGPSAFLPSAVQLGALHVPRWTHKARCSMTDRRDFYHQAKVSSSRARSNMTPFSFPIEDFEGAKALDIWRKELAERGLGGREVHGDDLKQERLAKADRPSELFPCFGALYQGDHLGVEFALRAHEVLLAREGLLHDRLRLRNKHPLPQGSVWEALIIDDYFCFSVQHRSVCPADTDSFRALERARETYQRHGLPGSPEKDLEAVDVFKAAGAEVDSADRAVGLGVIPAGAPLAKRLGLASISLRVAALPAISGSLASRLSGSWVSVLLVCRCLSSLVDDLFALGIGSLEDFDGMILPLPRKVAEELVELAIMAPVMFAHLTAYRFFP